MELLLNRYHIAVALGILKRNLPEIVYEEPDYRGADNEYQDIFPDRNNLKNTLRILHALRAEFADKDCGGVVDAMHQDGQLQGTCAVIDISEQAADGECSDALPNIAVDGGEEYG